MSSGKNKNYTKHGSKGGAKNSDKSSLGRTLFRSRFGNAAKEVGDLNKEKWVNTTNKQIEWPKNWII